MSISSPGIGSNLDINSIISQLMQVESQPLVALVKKESSFQAKLSAFGSLSSALGAFRTSLSAFDKPSAFQSLTATSSDTAVASATAGNKASVGTYNVSVTQLAQAQSISTSGVSSTVATIGNGTASKITFQFGTVTGGTFADGKYISDAAAVPTSPAFTQDAEQPSGTVIIDRSNNSLQGIRDAVNKAKIGVTATIVSDGSATPHRLIFTSNKTGAASSMKITVNGAESALSDLLAYDPAGTQNLRQNVSAQNANLTLNGIAITSPTSSIASAIEGVTLNIAKVGSTTVAVARNNGGVQTGINAMVKAYNELNSTIKTLSAYDPVTKRGGPLLGDSSPRNIQAQIRKILSTPLSEGSSGLSNLSEVGLSIDKDGRMSLDSAKLQNALNANTNGVTALFSSLGTTTDSLVSFSGSSSVTQPGTRDVYVTALATQGSVRGNKTLGATVIDATNKELTITLNGVSATVNLLENADGYSPTALAAQVQSAVNGASALSSADRSVTASIDANGYLQVTSNLYGSASKVSVTGTSVAALFGVATSMTGTDVSGSIGGSNGTGSGKFLTGATGSASEGMKLEIAGGAENASRGTVSFSQGYAVQLGRLIENLIGDSGMLKGRTDGIDRSIKDINRSRTILNNRLADTEKRYRAQFTALDASISKMSQTSNYLSQQLAQLANLSKE